MFWSCKHCGRVNPNYLISCVSCTKRKAREMALRKCEICGYFTSQAVGCPYCAMHQMRHNVEPLLCKKCCREIQQGVLCEYCMTHEDHLKAHENLANEKIAAAKALSKAYQSDMRMHLLRGTAFGSLIGGLLGPPIWALLRWLLS